LIRDTHKPSVSATPMIEPIVASREAVVNASTAEPEKPFTPSEETNPFGVPLPNHGDSHHEQTQQEDYLWGV
jgi:hypothetical protein